MVGRPVVWCCRPSVTTEGVLYRVAAASILLIIPSIFTAFNAMNHTEPYNASPAQGHSEAYLVMERTVWFYLELGDSQSARMHIGHLASELAFYSDISEAYRHALVLIMQWEEAERLKAEERQRQLAEQQGQQLLHDFVAFMQGRDKADAEVKQAARVELLAPLHTERAMVMWKVLQSRNLIDEHLQPVGLSRTEAAMLAYMMADRLGIRNKWKTFEALWNRRYMRNDFNDALEQKKNLEWQDVIKLLLSDC